MRRGRNSASKWKDYVLVECKHCGYKWQYTGSLNYATCPRCGSKTPVYPYVNSINTLFRRLKESIATTEEHHIQLELLRVLLLKYVREKHLDPGLLDELAKYANKKKEYIEEAGRDW